MISLVLFFKKSGVTDVGEEREAHACVRSMSDSVFVKYLYATQTLKYDNFLIKHLFLIPFAPLRSLRRDLLKYIHIDMFQNNFRDDKVLHLGV
jgi:hypothetical protein